uniref:Large ribosomal subunit protein eL14 n=1 Tax=Cuerna arida TaxID=1464854 RepID=A0A1B6GQB7_9HEMI
MTYKRFVERGRVALITKGPHKNKIVSIVDIIDQNFVLVDGPTNNVPRAKMNLKDLQLTKFVAKYPVKASSKFIAKTWKNLDIDSKWKNTSWAKKLEMKEKRSQMGDYDRFLLKKAKIERNILKKKFFVKLVRTRREGIEKAKAKKKAPEGKGKKSAASKTEVKKVEKKEAPKKAAAKK